MQVKNNSNFDFRLEILFLYKKATERKKINKRRKKIKYLLPHPVTEVLQSCPEHPPLRQEGQL